MSAALSVLESFASNTGIDHSKEMNVIHAIVAECEKVNRHGFNRHLRVI